MEMRLLRRTTSTIALLVAAATSPSAAEAQLLINPAGGSIFATSGDDFTVLRNLGGIFPFYALTHSTATVSSNGNINFQGNNFWTNGSMSAAGAATASGGGIIAPMFDDLYINGGSISDKFTANYYAVTWSSVANCCSVFSGQNRTFQTVLFRNAVTLGTFAFQTGDIAFSYGNLSLAPAGTSTVGVARNNTQFTVLPGTTDGQISNYSLVPNSDNEFVLFRFGTRGYNASIQTSGVTAIPEPATVVLLATGLVGVLGVASRRRKGVTSA